MSQAAVFADRCPLCGKPNECALCSHPAGKGPCWCAGVPIPARLLARVPPAYRNRACICRACVEKFHQTATASRKDAI